jgi:hypothetical protein
MMLDGMFSIALVLLGGIYWVQWSEENRTKDEPSDSVRRQERRLRDGDGEVLASH